MLYFINKEDGSSWLQPRRCRHPAIAGDVRVVDKKIGKKAIAKTRKSDVVGLILRMKMIYLLLTLYCSELCLKKIWYISIMF